MHMTSNAYGNEAIDEYGHGKHVDYDYVNVWILMNESYLCLCMTIKSWYDWMVYIVTYV